MRIKTVNIFSEKNSIILLNQSDCLLCCQLRFQCHIAEPKANDVEVCFISMCMTGRFVKWEMIHLHRNKKAVTFEPFPEKCTSMQIFYMEYLQQRKWSYMHDSKTVWLKPASSDGQYIQLDKGKYPKSLVCVPDTSSSRVARLSFLCKVDHNDSLHVNTSNHHPSPYTTSALLSEQRLLVIKDDLLFPMWGAKWTAFPFLILLSWFLAMQYPPEKIKSHTVFISGCLEVFPDPPPLHTLNFTVQNKRFHMWRTSFLCQQRLEWCVVLICVRPTHEHLGRYIFLFSNTVVHLLT